MPSTPQTPATKKHQTRRSLLGLLLLAPLLAPSAAGAALVDGTGEAVQQAEAGLNVTGSTVTRIAGADRYATSVAVSKSTHPNGAPVAVLTTGTSFPDALAGGPAASALGGPVLLVAKESVPQVVREELRRLNPGRVLVLGGTSAVSENVTAELAAAGHSVERIAGPGRYETAALVSAHAFPGAGSVLVATGADYPDALAGAAAAGAAKAPVLLTAKDTLPAATSAELKRLNPAKIIVLGGTSAVSAAVEAALKAHGSVTRVAGADRYATSIAVARLNPNLPSRAYLATGTGFADALTGGPAAAKANAPVLLTPPTCVPAPVQLELARTSNPAVHLLGGSSVLGAGVASLKPCGKIPDGVLVPGVTLKSINDPAGPFKGKVVSIHPSTKANIDTVLGQDTLPGLETTSSMSRRNEAIVAVNGDYAHTGGRPVHPFARNGRLIQSEQIYGRSVAADTLTPRVQVGPSDLRIHLHVPATGQVAPVSKVNSGPSDRGAVAITTREGGGISPVPANSCAARIQPKSAPYHSETGRTGQKYEVREVRCSAEAMTPGDDVLTAPLDGMHAQALKNLQVGQEVNVSWSIGWSNVLDTLGGNPSLVTAGKVVSANVDGSGGYFQRNPRTVVGHKADGTTLLVTIDGRGAGGSVGMTLREVAELLVRLGAVEAIGLDGGGSTTLVIAGHVQNVPSDSTGVERPVSSSLQLVPAATGIRTQGSSGLTPEQVSPEAEAAVEADIAADPGSTGGLMEAYPDRY